MPDALPGLQRGADQLGKSADLLCQVRDLRILGFGLGLLSNELGAEVVLITQQTLTGLLQEVLLLLQLAQLCSQLCLHTATDHILTCTQIRLLLVNRYHVHRQLSTNDVSLRICLDLPELWA